MTINPNQLQVQFTQDLLTKLNGIATGAQANPGIATEAEAVAGIDNTLQMTPLRVKQSIAANGGGGGGGGGGSSSTISGIVNNYTNNTGFSLSALTLVGSDPSGNMQPINPSTELEVQNTLGVLTATTANGVAGSVLISGLVQNVTTSFALNDIIYLNKDGTLTNVAPDIGVNGFVAGDFAVKVGKITKNSSSGGEVDFLVDISIIAQM